MKSLLLITIAAVAFAATEPVVPLSALRGVEGSINDRIRSNISDPYDLLGPARGTYVEGYGAVFTVEMNLVYTSPLTVSPFNTPSEEVLRAIHDRKVQKMEVLRDSMRGLMLSACRQLSTMPANEHVVLEAFLFNYRWENQRGLVRRIKLTGEKQKLLDAAAHNATPAEIAALIRDEEL